MTLMGFPRLNATESRCIYWKIKVSNIPNISIDPNSTKDKIPLQWRTESLIIWCFTES